MKPVRSDITYNMIEPDGHDGLDLPSSFVFWLFIFFFKKKNMRFSGPS